MLFLGKNPVNVLVPRADRLLLHLRDGAKFIGDAGPQMIGIMGGIHDNLFDAFSRFKQAARLRAIPLVTRRYPEAVRQTKRIHGGVDLGGQAAF